MTTSVNNMTKEQKERAIELIDRYSKWHLSRLEKIKWLKPFIGVGTEIHVGTLNAFLKSEGL